jgi:hypothetical protein
MNPFDRIQERLRDPLHSDSGQEAMSRTRHAYVVGILEAVDSLQKTHAWMETDAAQEAINSHRGEYVICAKQRVVAHGPVRRDAVDAAFRTGLYSGRELVVQFVEKGPAITY